MEEDEQMEDDNNGADDEGPEHRDHRNRRLA
jgi:hypothetical protein